MPDRSLDFYFDVISHNAYLAWHELGPLAKRHGLVVVPRAVVFGGMLKANGQLGPAEIPAKSAWMIRDVLRKARQLGIDINPPAAHPFNPLLALRAITALDDEADKPVLIDAVFRAVWVNGENVSDGDTLARVITDAGFDAEGLLEAAASAPVKSALREETDSAIARGVFGVPTLCVDGELFWGLDDYPALEAYLNGEPPADKDVLDNWYAVQPSIKRSR